MNTAYWLGALAYLAIAIAVNDLAEATEDRSLLARRRPVLAACGAGALGQGTLALLPEWNMGPYVQAACLLALPAAFWPVLARLKRGRLRIINRRLAALADRAADRAAAAEAWLALAEQTGHVGHWQLSLPGPRLVWSDEMCRIHGLWREHFTPQLESALAAFHPLDARRVGEIIQGTLGARGTFEVAARLRRPDGEIRHVIMRGASIVGASGVVEGVNGVMVDVTEPRRRELALAGTGAGRDQFWEDPVTELPSRAQFDISLNAEFKRAMRAKQPLGLVLIEIDDFASYATHHGEMEADACLRQVALAVHALPRRAGDVVARYAAAQIAVLLPLADTAGALRVARSLGEAVRALCLAHGASARGTVTISCGAACITVDDLYNPLELSRRAAEALAMARDAGGDRAQPHRLRVPEAMVLHGA
jgi:diguanylate cyclase (GGDEF)-like protein/PAS domain S-box-containing protein